MTDPLHFTDPAWSIQEARRQAISEAADLCDKWAELLESILQANRDAAARGGGTVPPGTDSQVNMARTLANAIRKLPIKAEVEGRKDEMTPDRKEAFRKQQEAWPYG